MGDVTANILTVGEALTDIVIRPGAAPHEYPGGSPMNVAVALGRLGHASHLLTHLAADERGEAIRTHVHASGAKLTPGSARARGATSTAEATIGADGAAQYVFSIDWDPDPAFLPEVIDVVHTSSIGATLAPGATTVREVVERYRSTALISYDPNARPTLMGSPDQVRGTIEQNIALADVVKASDEDLEWLYEGRDIDEVAESFLDTGVLLSVITRGADGATAFSPAGRVDVPGLPVKVADTVGAGDTFSAGLIDALAERRLVGWRGRDALERIRDYEVRAILEHAARLAAVTVSRPGANPPWAHEVLGGADPTTRRPGVKF